MYNNSKGIYHFYLRSPWWGWLVIFLLFLHFLVVGLRDWHPSLSGPLLTNFEEHTFRCTLWWWDAGTTLLYTGHLSLILFVCWVKYWVAKWKHTKEFIHLSPQPPQGIDLLCQLRETRVSWSPSPGEMRLDKSRLLVSILSFIVNFSTEFYGIHNIVSALRRCHLF